MNRSELVQRVRQLLFDTEVPYLWEDPDLEFYYYLSVREMCRRTLLYRETFDPILSVANQYLYNYPDRLLLPLSITYNGNDLTKVDYDRIKSVRGTVGTVKYYCLDYAPKQIVLHMTPEEDDKEIVIYGAAVPDSSHIQTAIPDEYTDYLLYGMLMFAFQKADSETVSPFASKYETLWNAYIEKINRELDRNKYVPTSQTYTHPGLL